MIKKIAFCALLLCGGASQAFDGTQKYVTKSAGVEHTLALSHWQVDRKGVPSFDYSYQQQAGACSFKLEGHVVAGFEEQGGKVELEVMNPEAENGKELPQVLMFYDDTLTMSLPLKGAPRRVGLNSTRLTAAQRAHSCGAGSKERLAVSFRQ